MLTKSGAMASARLWHADSTNTLSACWAPSASAWSCHYPWPVALPVLSTGTPSDFRPGKGVQYQSANQRLPEKSGCRSDCWRWKPVFSRMRMRRVKRKKTGEFEVILRTLLNQSPPDHENRWDWDWSRQCW